MKPKKKKSDNLINVKFKKSRISGMRGGGLRQKEADV